MTIFLDPSATGPSRTLVTPNTPTSSSDALETPLFEPDGSSQIAEEDQSMGERGSPPPPLSAENKHIAGRNTPPPPLPPLSLHTDEEDSRAIEEIREQFGWLVELLNQNQNRGWGTAYRDFADVSVLLNAVRGLGMVEGANNRISTGVFHASTGGYGFNLQKFTEVMGLGHSPGTWGNKLTMYFRLKALYSCSQYVDEMRFQSQMHQDAWEIVRLWVKDGDLLLPVSWVTTRYGNTKLRELVRDMLNEVCQSKCHISQSGFWNVCNCLLQGDVEYAEDLER